MLPSLDGLSVCRIIRNESDVPIVMLTARGSEVDRIVGLELGADDYMVKPFSLGEFLARVRAVLRRAPSARVIVDRLESGDLVLDLIARRVTRDGEEVRMTHKEFDLLATLMRNQGAVLSRDLLLERVWGYDYSGQTKTVDVHVRWLREKIEADPSNPQRIVTVRGVSAIASRDRSCCRGRLQGWHWSPPGGWRGVSCRRGPACRPPATMSYKPSTI